LIDLKVTDVKVSQGRAGNKVQDGMAYRGNVENGTQGERSEQRKRNNRERREEMN